MPELLTTTDLAKRLNLSTKSIYRYHRDRKITPEFTTPGGEHRWDPDKVLEQLRALRRRD